ELVTKSPQKTSLEQHTKSSFPCNHQDMKPHKVLANAFHVRLTSSPFTSTAEHIEAQHANFHRELNKRGIDVKIKHSFKRYTNVISIETDESNVKRIVEIEHVESVEPVKIYNRFKPSNPIEINKKKSNKVSETHLNATVLIAPNNDINAIHEITGVKKVHEILKLSGKGVKVGIIDTGIDYTHPALGGCFGPGCRVAFGYNFLNDTNDPYDSCDGHGTIVAGIIGGNDQSDDGPGYVGVAPDVVFGVYKAIPVFCPESDDDIDEKGVMINGQKIIEIIEILLMKAITKAVDDGMDIINMSLGYEGDDNSPLGHMISELAENRGIIFIIASGNEGESGVFGSMFPSNVQNSIGVGSFRTDKVVNFKAFDSKNPNFVINYVTQSALAFSFQSAKVKLLPMDKCLNDYKEFKDDVIIIDFRHGIPCLDIMVYFNNESLKPIGRLFILPDILEGLLLDFGNNAIIDSKQGDTLIQYLKTNTDLELDFSDKYGYMEYKSYSVVPSVFSSWGLNEEFDIKPEISAPGQMMFSTFPVNVVPYVVQSGTSIASPYMTGIAALYVEIFGKQQSFEQLKTALMNYAVPNLDRNNLLAPVFIQGAGLVDAFKVLKATSFVYPPKINLNDTVHFNGIQKLNVYNSGRKEMKYKLSHLPAPSFNGYNNTHERNYLNLEYFTNHEQYASVVFDYDQISVPPGSNVEVSVTFTLPKEIPKDRHLFYSGWIEIIPVDENMPIMTVPYAGLADDARSLPLFQTPSFPALINSTGDIVTEEDPIETYSLKPFNVTNDLYDYPTLKLNLATPTPNIITEILDVNKKLLGWVKDFTGIKFRKNPVILAVYWDGIIYSNLDNKAEPGTPAPDGNYFFKIKALKMYGDINNENDYESWISPKFRINRGA
ncbi:1523_t:CDS:2, partial [Funneliformis geosporum]